MNIFKKFGYRIYQTIFKWALPILPYRQPKILENEEDVLMVLNQSKLKRVLLVTDKGIRGIALTQSLEEKLSSNGIDVFVFDEVVPNPTTKNVADCVRVYKNNSCDALIAFGGGSVMDCAKATGALIARPKKTLGQMKGILKVRKKIPTLIAVPTTAGTGSETTLAAVIVDSETRHKYAINDFSLIPKYALLDAKLTAGLPKFLTATTGMDALTHAVEAYIGRSTTKKTRESALKAIKAIFENLLIAYQDGEDLEARQNMLIAAYDAGVAFTQSYVGNIHAVAHTLGGRYDVPHGLANAIIMPYVLRKYGRKIYKKLHEMGVYAGLFDEETPKEVGAKIFIEKIEEMNKIMNIGTQIPEIQEDDIPELALTAAKEANPLYPVPVIYNAEQLEEIYREVKNG